jgi:predicted HAD superfamily phosphohydrolase YqeG
MSCRSGHGRSHDTPRASYDAVQRAVGELVEAAAAIDGKGLPFALVIDVENTIVPYRSSPAEAQRLLDAAEVALHGLSRLRRLVFLSNSTSKFSPGAVNRTWVAASRSRARKPWTSRTTIARLTDGVPIAAVCGDQPLTDGLLAWRLGVRYVPIRIDRDHEPVWPRLLRLAGRVLLPLAQSLRPRPADEAADG